MNTLYYGDNLEILRNREYFPDECVDLIYLDPPFNSKCAYNVIFKDDAGADASAQIRAFDDTWTWTRDTNNAYKEMIFDPNAQHRTFRPSALKDLMIAFRAFMGQTDLMAYLTMMAIRLVELRRVLKPTAETTYYVVAQSLKARMKIVNAHRVNSLHR
ncbi:hypothetical protein KAH81_09905 [bacterium]|nr:hypothetical protein [bacterium]